MPPPRRLSGALVICLLFVLLVLASTIGGQFGATRGYAANATPPTPPTFIPTPIGSPPPPPTFTPTPQSAVPTAIPSAISTVTTATATPVPTATTTAAKLSFRLDAARVSRINNPGDFTGLIVVKPGDHVWLMMYYTLVSLPRSETRITTYSIAHGGKTLYKVAYKATVTPSQLGRFSRYQDFQIPSNLPYGKYVFSASLQLDKATKNKSWKFSVGKREIIATAEGSN